MSVQQHVTKFVRSVESPAHWCSFVDADENEGPAVGIESDSPSSASALRRSRATTAPWFSSRAIMFAIGPLRIPQRARTRLGCVVDLRVGQKKRIGGQVEVGAC